MSTLIRRSVPPSHRPPVSPPVMTSMPLGVRARRRRGNGTPGELHGIRPHATGGADDQHLLARPDLPLVAQALQRGRPEMETAAACSKVRLACLGASVSSEARAYSAKVPLPVPNT